ncbi:hypothetical protein [Paenibacillus herberti]|uniref:Uncharacterized protein n=1 Tax=Paenibacillus herberti TaxID=1619309 RepID=A0A229P1B3_9BACL|nr:hypothetical protein [Paenibacillus herberti]OXM15724.1 hypothetical protein CGZ75_03075 [Paenibacillus herberti]
MRRKLNWKIAAAGAALLVGGSWLGNLFYWDSMQLGKAYFLKQTVQIDSKRGQMLQLHFIQDIYSERKITAVQIEEFPEIRFDVREEHTRNRYQRQMKAWAELNPSDPWVGRLKSGPLNLMVYYTKGSAEKVPAGTIEITGKTILSFVSGGGGGSTSQFEAELTQNATLTDITTEPKGLLDDGLSLTVDGKSRDELTLPKFYQKDSNIRLNWSDFEPGIDPRLLHEAQLELNFRLPDGGTMVEHLPIYSYDTLSDRQLASLVRKERGGSK